MTLPPSLHGNYPASSLLWGGPTLRLRFRTLALVVLPLVASPLASQPQVPMFRLTALGHFEFSVVRAATWCNRRICGLVCANADDTSRKSAMATLMGASKQSMLALLPSWPHYSDV